MSTSISFYESLGYPFVLAEMPRPPAYCSCGRALVFMEERDGFIPETGAPDVEPVWRCPVTLGWWNRISLRFMTHDEYAPDHFGGWYWRRRHYQ